MCRRLQDLYASETGYGGCPGDDDDWCAGMEFDASLEEVLHLISSVGYAGAYPTVRESVTRGRMRIRLL